MQFCALKSCVVGDWVEMEWNSMCTILNSYLSGKNFGFPEEWIFFKNMQFMIPYLKTDKDGRSSSQRDITVSTVKDKPILRKKRPKNPWRGISRYEYPGSDSESEESLEDLEEEPVNNNNRSEAKESNNCSNQSPYSDHSSNADHLADPKPVDRQDLSDESVSINNHSTVTTENKTGVRGRKKCEIIKFNLRPSQIKMIQEVKKYEFLYCSTSRSIKKDAKIRTFLRIAKKVFNAEHVAKHQDVIGKLIVFTNILFSQTRVTTYSNSV